MAPKPRSVRVPSDRVARSVSRVRARTRAAPSGPATVAMIVASGIIRSVNATKSVRVIAASAVSARASTVSESLVRDGDGDGAGRAGVVGLLVIRMTPRSPRSPNRAVAAAPLITSTLAIEAGAIARPAVALISFPSSMKSGSPRSAVAAS